MPSPLNLTFLLSCLAAFDYAVGISGKSLRSDALQRRNGRQQRSAPTVSESATGDRYLDSWAVEVDGGDAQARAVAQQYGFDLVDKNHLLGNLYHFKLHNPRNRRKREAPYQIGLRAVAPLHGHTQALMSDHRVNWAEQQLSQGRTKRGDVSDIPHDPMFHSEWYLLNSGQTRSPAGFDHDILPVWEQGYTGKGVTITIVDDGLEHSHPDLRDNYSGRLSFDLNRGTPDPAPRYDSSNSNKHGTRCAGVAAAARNDICGTGVAYHARIGGIKLLDGHVTDYLDSKAISLRPQEINIYSNSWGPTDNGKTVSGPGRVTKRTLSSNAIKGRSGFGSIFMWASGVGGLHGDSCAYDGFINSIYSIAISAGTDAGQAPWYAEPCAAVLATGLSSGNPFSRKVVSTDLHHRCTDQFSGTSAATPMMAGVVSLVLEARPFLTWRDIQHLFMMTSRPNILDTSTSRAVAEQGWEVNACGRRVNPWFGYGLINATAMLNLAKQWMPVMPLHSCSSQTYFHERIITNKGISFQISTKGCAGSAAEVTVLEQVQLVTTIYSSYRGSLVGYLTSPKGTRIQVVFPRRADKSRFGLRDWAFTSTFTWGEDPRGNWTVELRTNHKKVTARLEEAQLIFHGTAGVTKPYAQLAKDHGAMTCSFDTQ